MSSVQPRIVDEQKIQVTSIFEKTGDHAILDHVADSDEEVLGALGYKQEFKRDLSMWTCFSVSFSVLGLVPSIASTLSFNLAYTGQAGSIWSWLVAGAFTQSVAFSMAEICSSMPTAGGLYYAAAVLAPEGWGPFWSWITGWSNMCAYTTCGCALNYALALMILGAASIQHPDYNVQVWQVYLLLLALQALDGLIVTNSTKFLGRFNAVGATFNSVLVLIFVAWLPAGSINTPKINPSTQVWTEITNGTEWSDGFAFLMSFLSVLAVLAGYDAGFHLSEEVNKSNVAAPRTIVLTAQLGFYIGFFVLLVIAYTVKDIEDVVAGQYGSPMASLCLQVLGPESGLALLTLIMVAQFWVAESCMVTASRVVFAYSRDGAIPGSRWLKRVNRHTKTPVNAAWLVGVIGCLLGLLMFVSPVAIGAVFSLGSIANYISFTIPIALKVFSARSRFRPGPWNLGRFSVPVGIVACCWTTLIVPVLCFPATRGKDLNKNTMNYTCLIYFGVMGLALLWYAVSARKWYKGPKVNVEHMIQERAGVNVVDVSLTEAGGKSA